MDEKRRFKRVRVSASCSLTYNNITYLGRLENISLNGALISFNDGIVIPKDERCNLKVYLEETDTPLRTEIEVIHSNFTMLGVRFDKNDRVAEEALANLLERLTSGVENPVNEQKIFQEAQG